MITSATRMETFSRQPRWYPAQTPHSEPTSRATATAGSATDRVVRAGHDQAGQHAAAQRIAAQEVLPAVRQVNGRLVGEQQVLLGGQVAHQRGPHQSGQANQQQHKGGDGGESVLEEEAEQARLAVPEVRCRSWRAAVRPAAALPAASGAGAVSQ